MPQKARESILKTLSQATRVIFGQDDLLKSIMAALVCEGHVLVEGLPGLGKTMSIRAISKLCSLHFQRIQFTPDLLPSDLIGTMIYNQAKEEFSTKFGPIFTQLLLADEINRSPAKVQSALLEAMAEKQVTIGDKTHPLTSPFVVLATQNPIEQEGTYQLPEAQMDRFMMKVYVDYPDINSEKEILDLSKDPIGELAPLLSKELLFQVQEHVEKVYVDEKIKDYIVRLVNGTRPGTPFFLKEFEGAVVSGASPRASLWLYRVSKFKAFMDGKEFVSPENVISIAQDILAHRIILSYEATVDKVSGRSIVLKIANELV
ncbi:MAG: MoxR family ATPase [Bacteriovoracales bacterium]|nr:MoxR family ATPase [Bacteriovoracales bacterium]